MKNQDIKNGIVQYLNEKGYAVYYSNYENLYTCVVNEDQPNETRFDFRHEQQQIIITPQPPKITLDSNDPEFFNQLDKIILSITPSI